MQISRKRRNDDFIMRFRKTSGFDEAERFLKADFERTKSKNGLIKKMKKKYLHM